MQKNRWAFTTLPKSNPLVGLSLQDITSAQRVRKLLPPGMCILRSGENTFTMGAAGMSVLDVLSVASACGLITRAMGCETIIAEVTTRPSDTDARKFTAGFSLPPMFDALADCNTYAAVAMRLVDDITINIPNEYGIQVYELAAPYRANIGAHFHIGSTYDANDLDYDARVAQRVIFESTRFDESSEHLQRVLRWLRRVRAPEYRLTQSNAHARDIEAETLIRDIVKNANYTALPNAAMKYCARSAFAIKLATLAMSEAFKVCALLAAKNGAQRADDHVCDRMSILDPENFVMRCNSRARDFTNMEVFTSAMASLLAPFSLHKDAMKILTMLFNEGRAALSHVYVMYCVALAASAVADASAYSVYNEASHVGKAINLALLLENESNVDRLRRAGIALVDDLLKNNMRDALAVNSDGESFEMQNAPAEVQEQAENYINALRDLVTQADDEKLRDVLLSLISNMGAVSSRQGVIGLPSYMLEARLQSQAQLRALFPGDIVLPVTDTTCEVDSLVGLRLLLASLTEDNDEIESIAKAANTLGVVETPKYSEVLKEAERWQHFMFPLSALDASLDSFDFL